MMLKLEIGRPRLEQSAELNGFFRTVIEDTFAKEGIAEMTDDLEAEIESKRIRLERDFQNVGEDACFLIAMDGSMIVGSIEYGPASGLIGELTHEAFSRLPEVGTVFVHPGYQGRGIGNALLEAVFSAMRSKGIGEACLDSGYKTAQKIWTKKFGEPDYRFQDYWGEGNDHMIWKIKVPGV